MWLRLWFGNPRVIAMASVKTKINLENVPVICALTKIGLAHISGSILEELRYQSDDWERAGVVSAARSPASPWDHQISAGYRSMSSSLCLTRRHTTIATCFCSGAFISPKKSVVEFLA